MTDATRGDAADAFPPTLDERDLDLLGRGRHERLWECLGARPMTWHGVDGVAFAVWAPSARTVRVVGDFNGWDGGRHPLRRLGTSGVWERFLPGVADGTRYKFEIETAEGAFEHRADPCASAMELRPGNASRVHRSTHRWDDERWLARRGATRAGAAPLSIYEVHLGSWRTDGTPSSAQRGYRELAEELAEHVTALGFTHVELLPIAEHPYDGSWGYQVTGYFAPTSRFGDPDDFRAFVDHLHACDIGVIADWVPAHFPRDDWALARFDGTPLYEHPDPQLGANPDWGTLVFDYRRPEVRGFLLASALYWVEELHVDGLRVDAVASMLYRDHSREPGEWTPNEHGGNEHLEGIAFLRELTATVTARNPDVLLIAEESTSWRGVTAPVADGGLGFDRKWNMGWTHDTLAYLAEPFAQRPAAHHRLTFGIVYAWDERFVLALSHDEVVADRGSLLQQAHGSRLQQLASVRALYAWMWAHPGAVLLFMSGELAQDRPWSEERDLDWGLHADEGHAGVERLVGDLNACYRAVPALWRRDDEPGGFSWLDADSAETSVLAFVRHGGEGDAPVVCVANLSPDRRPVRVGLPRSGAWTRLLDTDAVRYGGRSSTPADVLVEPTPWQGMPQSAELSMPALSVVWLTPAT